MRVWVCGITCLAMGVVSATGATAPKGPPQRVAFYPAIARILYKNCTSCHRPGEPAPFSLLSYQGAKKHAFAIAKATKSHSMPPWLPEKGYGEFKGAPSITDAQIALIGKWVRDGSLEGNPADAPAPPNYTSDWQLGPPDMILHVKYPYKVPAVGKDRFWNFVLPVPVKKPRWVRAVAIRPNDPMIFHHCNAVIDRLGVAKRREVVPGAGYPGMDLNARGTSYNPDGDFMSWKPGGKPFVARPGMAWLATPGMDLILNAHLHPMGMTMPADPEVGLYFTNTPRTKYPILLELEHDGAIDIPADDKDYVMTDNFRLPEDSYVLAVYPHCHMVCHVVEGYATLPDGKRKWLIRIPDWNMMWDAVYSLKKPLLLPKGTVLSMRFHYDNSSGNPQNPNKPPKEIVGGDTAHNEMGDLWFQLLPAAPGDHRREIHNAWVRQRYQKYPNDFDANYNMGNIRLTEKKPAEAIPFFQKAAQLQPESVLGPMGLGDAYFAELKLPEAEQQFRKALSIDPKSPAVLLNLASVDAELGNLDEAVKGFKQVLAEHPDYKNTRSRLGDVLFAWGDELAKSGNNQQAAERYSEALVYLPKNVALHTSLGAAFARLGQMDKARAELQAAVRINPNFAPAQKLLAAIGQ